jgi:hypothetical protein
MLRPSTYLFVERLCLFLYYTCTKFRHYNLASTCVVVCQHDVIKYMLQQPILRGRLGKWAYTLVEYNNLLYEPLRMVKGQVVADLIVDHTAVVDDDACLVEVRP